MANANHGNIIDYAMPMMKIENLMRQIHDHCLNSKYDAANALCPNIIAEARILSASLVLMNNDKEKE
jgi:hypothetical protein